MAGKKKILIICGTGIATSTVVASKVREFLSKQSQIGSVQIVQGKVVDLLHGTDADVVVSTTQVPKSVTVPVINAVPLLTGSGTSVLENILRVLTGS